MRIGGIVDISTKDIPNKPAMVIFTVGCNFNCGFCHNKYLLQPNVGREYSIKELIEIINTNALVSGVSITGGEPTLQNDLVDFCQEIHEKTNKYLSVDTNGSNPESIVELIPYINRMALDLKAPLILEKYENITRSKVDLDKIIQSIHLLNSKSEIDFEIRITYFENLLQPNDIKDIIFFLKNISFKGNFVLQQYQYQEGVGEKFKEIFSKPAHEVLVNLLHPYKNLDLSFRLFIRDEVIGYVCIDEL